MIKLPVNSKIYRFIIVFLIVVCIFVFLQFLHNKIIVKRNNNAIKMFLDQHILNLTIISKHKPSSSYLKSNWEKDSTMWDPSRGGRICTNLKTYKSKIVPICVYNEYTDMYISHDIIHTGTWEPVLTKFLIKELLKPNRGLIDVGANLGVFTLHAAHLNRPVIAIEPAIGSLELLKESLHLGKATTLLTSDVQIYNNAIAFNHKKLHIYVNKANRGDTQITNGNCFGVCPTVQAILLKDIAPVMPAADWILKLDCQGCEIDAILGSGEVLKNVSLIIMEWELIKSQESILQVISFLLNLDFIPETLGGDSLNVYDYKQWPFDVIWRLITDKM